MVIDTHQQRGDLAGLVRRDDVNAGEELPTRQFGGRGEVDWFTDPLSNRYVEGADVDGVKDGPDDGVQIARTTGERGVGSRRALIRGDCR